MQQLNTAHTEFPETQWVNDIHIQTTKVLSTTGGTVWNAARRCASYLEAEASRIGLDRPVRVLELGAGCGLLGMLVARNLPHAAEVCLTEQANGGALDHLRRNVDANRHLPNMGCVTVCACDWTHFMNEEVLQAARSKTLAASCCSSDAAALAAAAGASADSSPKQQEGQAVQQLLESQQGDGGQQQQQHQTDNNNNQQQQQQAVTLSAAELADLQKLLHTHWDVIIGSDLVYNTAGVHGFPRVLAALMPQHTTSSTSSSDPDSSSSSSSSVKKDHGPISSSSNGPSSSSSSGPSSSSSQQPGPVMYYAHTKHRFDAMDVDLVEQLEGLGLCCQEVMEEGQELPPPSPPPFSSLYPDMRCAVFRISRRSAAAGAAAAGM